MYRVLRNQIFFIYEQIVRALEGDVSLEDLHEGIKGQFGSGSTSIASSEFDANSYNAKMKPFRKPALIDSTDYPSSEYGPTSEYSHNSNSASSNHSQEMDNKKGMNRPQGPVWAANNELEHGPNRWNKTTQNWFYNLWSTIL